MTNEKNSKYTFVLMFLIILLLNVSFTVLRSVRNTLSVVDLGSGSQTIPIFELFGALPGAILMTWGLAWLINRYSIKTVFLITLSIFVGYFILFAYAIYPYVIALKARNAIGTIPLNLIAMSFHVMSELWKPALPIILFWGLVNQFTPIDDAKKLYAPLMLGNSLGSMLAGPAVSLCTSSTIWKWIPFASEQWQHAISSMTFLITALSVITAFFYYKLWHRLALNAPVQHSEKEEITLKESLSTCFQSPALRLLSWIVVADYIAYSLGEVIFLDVLKKKYTQPVDYCYYMGQLSLWSGILTVLCSLFIAPYVLQKTKWVIAALATPICLFITEGAFFVFLRGQSFSHSWFHWSEAEWIGVVIALGSIQYCLCRSTKYTLFDASKEIAFVLMPTAQKMKGKLVVDGLCSRVGRGSASVLSICFIQMCGGVIASALITGVVALGLAWSWIMTTFKLAKEIDREPVQAKGQAL